MTDVLIIKKPVVALVSQWVRSARITYEIVLLDISDIEAHFLQPVVLEWLQSAEAAVWPLPMSRRVIACRPGILLVIQVIVIEYILPRLRICRGLLLQSRVFIVSWSCCGGRKAGCGGVLVDHAWAFEL